VTSFFAGVRAFHYFCLAILFGGAAFEAVLRKHVPALAIDKRRLYRWAILGALVTALLWLGLTTGQMGGNWADAVNITTLRKVLMDTQFGAGFLIRIGFLLVLGGLCVSNSDAKWRALAAAGALAAIAITGHAEASGPPQFGFIGGMNDAVHLLAAGFWIGALILLGSLLTQKASRPFVSQMLALFSNRGMIAVALLVMTGIINALTILLSGPGHPATVYVVLLCIKIALALSMVAVAVFNRLRLTPQIARGAGSAALRTSIVAELTLAIAILILVGFLGQIIPMT
jgi:putative copper resistance protein D